MNLLKWSYKVRVLPFNFPIKANYNIAEQYV